VKRQYRPRANDIQKIKVTPPQAHVRVAPGGDSLDPIVGQQRTATPTAGRSG